MKSQEEMINVLTESFLSSALIVFLLSAFFLRTWRTNIIFIFVSLLPVALTFLFMYIFNFTINVATVMTFSISLGLLGDSSFHIIYGKSMRFKNFGEYHRGVLSPVLASGLLLFLCFGIFTYNSFLPIKQFGGVLAFIMLMGTIVDLFVLPTLLYKSHFHKTSYENPKN
jgi:predicted RND superfamily exporter protein